MNLRTITIIAAIGFLISFIARLAVFPYEILSDNPKQWGWVILPLLTDLPLSLFLFTLYSKQK